MTQDNLNTPATNHAVRLHNVKLNKNENDIQNLARVIPSQTGEVFDEMEVREARLGEKVMSPNGQIPGVRFALVGERVLGPKAKANESPKPVVYSLETNEEEKEKVNTLISLTQENVINTIADKKKTKNSIV